MYIHTYYYDTTPCTYISLFGRVNTGVSWKKYCLGDRGDRGNPEPRWHKLILIKVPILIRILVLGAMPILTFIQICLPILVLAYIPILIRMIIFTSILQIKMLIKYQC